MEQCGLDREGDRMAQAKTKKKSLNELFQELDELMQKLEEEESLEKSFEMYKKGVGLLKEANDSIDRIEKQVKVLDEDGILS